MGRGIDEGAGAVPVALDAGALPVRTVAGPATRLGRTAEADTAGGPPATLPIVGLTL